MVNTVNGTERVYELQSDGQKYRYDFEESGMRGIVIVDPVKGKTAILMPDEKYVHFTPTTSRTSLMNDPYQSFIYSKKNFEEKPAGTESVSGYECSITEFHDSDRKVITAWHSDELGFLLKMVNNVSENTFMEVRDIIPGEIDKELFVIPEDYTEVDERMRPVIPEPPPPDSWNTIDSSLPIAGEFKRGDRIMFTVPENKNYKLNLVNQSDDPAKIIWTGMRDGQELPGNEQGPLSYRTKRLHGGESSSYTYRWTSRDKIIIQVYEGVINIELAAEIK
ncbi:MAG: hypothetical protein P1P83_06625 [Bacteroidales bacterium]|nr:hypothetical protein [Bacteroidales bacterium]MDT8374798.1 hypothetical protein [Bacteroidales bacterium]